MHTDIVIVERIVCERNIWSQSGGRNVIEVSMRDSDSWLRVQFRDEMMSDKRSERRRGCKEQQRQRRQEQVRMAMKKKWEASESDSWFGEEMRGRNRDSARFMATGVGKKAGREWNAIWMPRERKVRRITQ
jgi:hypothetical protein